MPSPAQIADWSFDYNRVRAAGWTWDREVRVWRHSDGVRLALNQTAIRRSLDGEAELPVITAERLQGMRDEARREVVAPSGLILAEGEVRPIYPSLEQVVARQRAREQRADQMAQAEARSRYANANRSGVRTLPDFQPDEWRA